MRPSGGLLSPIVTLLSPTPAASRAAQEILRSVFGLEDVSCDGCGDDELNAKFRASFAAKTVKWNSVASRCSQSGALVHLLSVENSKNDQGGFSLLGVTQRTTHDKDTNQDILSSLALLASHFPSSIFSLSLRHFFRRPLTVNALLRRHQGLPVLDLPAKTATDPTPLDMCENQASQRLKEIVFSVCDSAVYEDGSTALSHLSESALSRPVTGLYQWSTNGGVGLRVIPAAKRDLKGSSCPVVLIFHCKNLEEILQIHSENSNSNTPVQFSKIGFTGQGNGQLRLQANKFNLLNGLDLRWCERTKPTSVFQEAHESLLASSLPELQSTNVLKSTGKGQPGEDDRRIGAADCWVEVRTMVQNPRGFLPSRVPKVAKAPPSYPE